MLQKRLSVLLLYVFVTDACLEDPAALDPNRNPAAVAVWVAGYNGLVLNLPDCGHFTPRFRLHAESELEPFRSLDHSLNNVTHNYTLMFLHGCSPVSVANSVSGTSFSLTYHTNRTIASRAESGTGKIANSTINRDGRVTRVYRECTTTGAIDKYFLYDSLNRITESFTLDDAACSVTADHNYSSFSDIRRVPTGSAYIDSGGLYSDVNASYVYEGDKLTEQSQTCIRGYACSNALYRYTYDSLGRLIQEQRVLPSTQTTTFTYNAAGQLATINDATANVVFTYDAEGRVATVVESAPAPALTLTLSY